MTIQRNTLFVFLPVALSCTAIYAQQPYTSDAAPVGSKEVAGMRGQKTQEFRVPENAVAGFQSGTAGAKGTAGTNAADCPKCDTSGEYVQKKQPENGTNAPGAGSKQQSASTNGTGGGSSQIPEAVGQSLSSSSGGYQKESAKGNDGDQSEQSKQHAQASKRKHQETMKVLQKSQQNQKETSDAIKP